MHDVSVEANGCAQNSYTLAIAMRAAGYTVHLVQEEDPRGDGRKKVVLFGGVLGDAETLTVITDKDVDYLSRVGVWVYGTRTSAPNMAKALKARRVMRTGMKVGNNPMLDREASVSGGAQRVIYDAVHDIAHAEVSEVVVAVPLLRRYLQTYEAHSRKRVALIPHAWNDTLFRERTKQACGRELPDWSPTLRRTVAQGKRAILAVWEPTVSVVKTAWEVLQGLEWWWNCANGEDEIEEVHIFCCKDDSYNEGMFKKLEIAKARRKDPITGEERPVLVRHAREFSGAWYQQFMNSQWPIVEVHANLDGNTNDLNYKSYEALKKRIPFAHNSESLRALGYYYPPEDWAAMRAAVLRAANTHHLHFERMGREADAYLKEHCDPTSESVWRPTAEILEGAFALVQTDYDIAEENEDKEGSKAKAG
jgi:hypothetical protein